MSRVSTRERRGGSRTARSACSWLTRAATAKRWLIVAFICRRDGQRIGRDVPGRRSRRRSSLQPSQRWRAPWSRRRSMAASHALTFWATLSTGRTAAFAGCWKLASSPMSWRFEALTSCAVEGIVCLSKPRPRNWPASSSPTTGPVMRQVKAQRASALRLGTHPPPLDVKRRLRALASRPPQAIDLRRKSLLPGLRPARFLLGRIGGSGRPAVGDRGVL